MEKERVLEALETIKELCKEHESCTTCPLRDTDYYSDTECTLDNENISPNNWDINYTDAPWRAFCG